MLIKRIVGDAHPRDAGELGRGLRGARDIAAGDQHIDRRAQLQRRRQRPGGDVGEMAVRDFGKKQGRHRQITPASSLSLATSSATVLTLTPALRPLGSVVFSTLRRGATSTP